MQARRKTITPEQRLELVADLLSSAFIELASHGLLEEDDETRTPVKMAEQKQEARQSA